MDHTLQLQVLITVTKFWKGQAINTDTFQSLPSYSSSVGIIHLLMNLSLMTSNIKQAGKKCVQEVLKRPSIHGI